MKVVTPVLEASNDVIATVANIHSIFSRHSDFQHILVCSESAYSILITDKSLAAQGQLRIVKENKKSLWGAYNTVVSDLHDYYIPLSLGDKIVDFDLSEFNRIMHANGTKKPLIVFTSVIKNNVLIRPIFRRIQSTYSTSGFVSGHSAACIIHSSIHINYGLYSDKLDLASDNLLFEKVFLNCRDRIVWNSKVMLGYFKGGGISTYDLKKSLFELSQARVIAGRSKLISKAIYIMRILRWIKFPSIHRRAC